MGKQCLEKLLAHPLTPVLGTDGNRAAVAQPRDDLATTPVPVAAHADCKTDGVPSVSCATKKNVSGAASL